MQILSINLDCKFGKLALRVHHLGINHALRRDERDSVRIKKRIVQLVAKHKTLFVDFVLLMYYTFVSDKRKKAI